MPILIPFGSGASNRAPMKRLPPFVPLLTAVMSTRSFSIHGERRGSIAWSNASIRSFCADSLSDRSGSVAYHRWTSDSTRCQLANSHRMAAPVSLWAALLSGAFWNSSDDCLQCRYIRSSSNVTRYPGSGGLRGVCLPPSHTTPGRLACQCVSLARPWWRGSHGHAACASVHHLWSRSLGTDSGSCTGSDPRVGACHVFLWRGQPWGAVLPKRILSISAIISTRFPVSNCVSARQTFFTPPYAHPGMCYLWWLRTSSSSIPFQGVTV